MLTLKQIVHDFLRTGIPASTSQPFTLKQLVQAIPEATNRRNTVDRALRKLRDESKVLSVRQGTSQELLWRANPLWAGPSTISPTKGTSVIPPTTTTTVSATPGAVSLEAAVEALVLEFVSDKKVFSAYEVTTELRSRSNSGSITLDMTGRKLANGTPWIEHSDVRAIVHDMFAQRKMDGYDQASNGTYLQYVPMPPTAPLMPSPSP